MGKLETQIAIDGSNEGIYTAAKLGRSRGLLAKTIIQTHGKYLSKEATNKSRGDAEGEWE